MITEDSDQLEGLTDTWFTEDNQVSGINHRGKNNRVLGIALGSNELCKRLCQSEKPLKTTCFGFLKSKVPGQIPEKGPDET